MKRVHRKVKTSDILGMHRHSRGAIARSKSIDHQLDEDREKRQREVQLLILGGASAGKSTFIKQLRYHHGDGYPDNERQRFRQTILENLSDGIHAVLDTMTRQHLQINHPKTKDLITSFRETCPRIHPSRRHIMTEDGATHSLDDTVTLPSLQPIPPLQEYSTRKSTNPCSATAADSALVLEHSKNFLTIVSCQEFQECYRNRQTSGVRLYHAEEYFIDNVERILCNDYIPSVQDILYIRKPTIGVQEHSFHVDGLSYRVIDVAGQKNQRKKWIHFFESVTAVVFFASLSGYNERLEEDDQINNLQDSLLTFRELTWNEFLERTDFILFLNKHDLFVKYMAQYSIKACFPDYNGPEKDAEASLTYVKGQFMERTPRDKHVYAHVSTATNVDLMKAIIKDVVTIIVEINVRKCNQPL